MNPPPSKNPEPVRSEDIESIGGRAACSAPDLRDPEGVRKAVVPGGGEIRRGKLAGLSLPVAIWVLSWPILTESFLQSLVGLVDTALSAGLSEAATDAIGGASYIVWALNLLGFAIGIGATALVSRSVGRGRQAVADTAAGQALLLAVSAGVVVAGVLMVVAGPMAVALNLSDEAYEAMTSYLWILAPGVPAVSVITAGIACQRGAGDAKRPLVTMLILNVVNIVASLSLSGVDLFGFTNPSPLELGIRGIAWGTLIAWTVGAVITVWWLARGTSGVTLRRKRLRPHWHTMRRLVRVGMPNFFESLGMWVGNFAVILIVGVMATEGLLGSHIIAIRIEAFSFLPGFAMGMAAGTLTGQYLGAGNIVKARRSILLCALLAAGIMGLFGAAFLTISPTIVGWFSQQETHLATTPRLIFIAGFIQIPFGVGLVMRNALRGAGDTKAVMAITWFTTFLVRLPLAWFFSGVEIPLWGGMHIPNPGPEWGLWGLWIGLCSELVIRCALFTARFLQGGWQQAKV